MKIKHLASRLLYLVRKYDKETDIDKKEILVNEIEETIKHSMLTTVPYQCCPVCNGTGRTVADGFTTSVYQTCKVCNGVMIIPMHILSTDYKLDS